MAKLNASIFTTREGHRSLAEAVSVVLEDLGLNVYQNEHAGHEFGLYTPFYQLFPQLWQIPYRFHTSRKAQQMIETYAKVTFQDKVIAQIKEQQPAVVISTWFMLHQIIAQANTHESFQFLNVVSDPRTFANIIINPEATNLVFDKKAANRAQRVGAPKNKVVVSGWFVRDRFESNYVQEKVRTQLGLPQDKLILLIVAGSEGTATILKILPAFINCNRPVEVIVACGSSKKLAATVNTLSKVIEASNRGNTVAVRSLAFTREIHLYLQAADLIMGKAGPNLLFEATATKTPFFAFTHISGQEDGNLNIIKEYKLGWVEEDPLKAIRLLKQILVKPELLDRFNPSLVKMAEHNHQAKKILADLVKQGMEKRA